MKKLISLLLTGILLTMLVTGCGGSEEGAKEEKSDKKASEMESTEVTVSGFKVKLPDGWHAKEDEMSPQGSIYIIKDNEEIQGNPYIHATSGITTLASEDFYDDVKEEKPRELDNFTWEGYSGSGGGYPVTVLGAKQKDGTFIQLDIFTEVDGKSFSLDDEDVLFIIGSLELAK